MKSLMTLCTVVITMCAASSLFVSCEKYELLKEQVQNHENRLSRIERIVEQLQKLTERVDALYTLKFQITADNELQYSFDGGATWVSTGVFSLDWDEEITLVDNINSVTITIGDSSFTIEKPEEIIFEIRSGKVFFASEATQIVGIKSQGIEDISVLSVPKGWAAELNSDGTLSVTAPNAEDTVPGWTDDWEEIPAVAAATGYVKLHACSVDGKCLVGKLPVEVSKDQLVVKAFGDKYTIAATNSWAYLYFDISTRDSFEKDVEELLNAYNEAPWNIAWYEDYVAEGSITELLGSAPVPGTEYIIWAVTDMMELTFDNIVYTYYNPVKVTVKEDEALRTAFDVYVSVDVAGAESYYAFAAPHSETGWGMDYHKTEMIASLEYGGYGKLYTESYNGSLYRITEGTLSYIGMGNPNETCSLLILPMDGRLLSEYTVADIQEFVFTTNPLTPGANIGLAYERLETYLDWAGEEVPVDPYTEVYVQVTPDTEDWLYYYNAWMSEEDYALNSADETLLVEAILANPAAYPIDKEEFSGVVMNTLFSPGETKYLVSFFVDATGKYGTVLAQSYDTKTVEKVDIDIALTSNLVDGVLANNNVLEVGITTTPEAASYRYVWIETSYYNQYEGMTDAELADAIFFGESYTEVKAEDIEDGKLLVPEHSYNSSYFFAILPLDADGNPGNSAAFLEYSCAFVLDEVITDPAQFEKEPVITVVIPEKKNGESGEAYYYKDGSTNQYSISYTVKPAEGTEVVALIVSPQASADYGYDHTISDIEKAGGLWANTLPGQSYYTYTFTEETTTEPRAMWDYYNDPDFTAYVLVSWKVGDKYYFKEVDLSAEFEFMYSDLNWDGVAADVTNTPSGKQWTYVCNNEDLMPGVGLVLDFGVTMPNIMVLAADVTALGAPAGTPHTMVNALPYTVTPMTESCGYIAFVQLDDDGEVAGTIAEFPYYGLTADSCSFGYNDLLAEPVIHAELTSVTVDNGVAPL